MKSSREAAQGIIKRWPLVFEESRSEYFRRVMAKEPETTWEVQEALLNAWELAKHRLDASVRRGR